MDMNWKSLAAMLPVQPCDELKRDVLMGIYDMHDLGGDLILYHQESVGLADEIGQIMDPQDWAHWEQSKKRRWGARCTCTSCGEDFIAGYVKNGIVLAEGPDGQTYDGYAEQGPDSSVYLDGDEAVCPHCWTAATITGFEGYGKFWKAYAYPPAHIDREEWVSVEERLPEDEKDGETVLVIVFGKPHENITLHGTIMTAGYFRDEGWVLNEYPEWEGPEVTHWMPLPSPPAELEKRMGVRG